jgi:hypothetical protein
VTEGRVEEGEKEQTPEGLKPLVEQARPISPVVQVWQAYERHHPRARLTPDRRKRIQTKLRHYDVDTLIAAINGNHRDPWCCGENADGKEYHDLELILRNGGTIERYASTPLEPARRVVGSAVPDRGAEIAARGRRFT